MPSRYEPWGVAIAEAAAAGLPILCTEACGASVELVRPYYNGLIVPTDDAQSLADAMIWCHAHRDRLAEFGERGRSLAAAYSADVWAERWAAVLRSGPRQGR